MHGNRNENKTNRAIEKRTKVSGFCTLSRKNTQTHNL